MSAQILTRSISVLHHPQREGRSYVLLFASCLLVPWGREGGALVGELLVGMDLIGAVHK